MTSLNHLKPNSQKFTAANDTALNAIGSTELCLNLGGITIRDIFTVMDGLSQDVILGIPFMQNHAVILDYGANKLSLFNGAVTVPLITAVDQTRAIRTIKRLRIPANHEIIFRARPPRKTSVTTGITETLPETLGKGVKVASALVDCSRSTITCRVANPNPRPIIWPAGYAFAYVNPLDTSAAGVNLINVTDCINPSEDNDQRNGRTTNDAPIDAAFRDDEPCAQNRQPLPPHEQRLSELRQLGLNIGQDVLNQTQAERLSAILYKARDIMATSVTQVPEIRVPRHTIPLVDTKPAIQKRFRYDPIKEQKLENLCDDLLTAGIIKESTSLWNSPVFLVTKPDGSSRFLVDFRAVNAKTKPLFCALPSLDDIFDQIAEEKPEIFSVLDLRAGYYGIGIEEESQPCTAFSTKK